MDGETSMPLIVLSFLNFGRMFTCSNLELFGQIAGHKNWVICLIYIVWSVTLGNVTFLSTPVTLVKDAYQRLP